MPIANECRIIRVQPQNLGNLVQDAFNSEAGSSIFAKVSNMLLESNTNMVQSVEPSNLPSASDGVSYIEILHFVDDKALVISHNAIALYRDASAISDPLGNGLIQMSTFPQGLRFSPDNTPWVIHHVSGFIELVNHHIVLILPNAIRLYSSKEDALKNRNIIVELPFSH